MIEPCVAEDEKSYMQSFISICKRSQKLQIDFENPICAIIAKEALLEGRYHRASFFGIKIPDGFSGEVTSKLEKPSGIYATTYHKGSYETMYLSYERLLRGIKERGYSVCGNAYEIDLLSTLTNVFCPRLFRHTNKLVFSGFRMITITPVMPTLVPHLFHDSLYPLSLSRHVVRHYGHPTEQAAGL
jgi:effector-binding domain-containing protein